MGHVTEECVQGQEKSWAGQKKTESAARQVRGQTGQTLVSSAAGKVGDRAVQVRGNGSRLRLFISLTFSFKR